MMGSDMSPFDKPLWWLTDTIRTPPFSDAARIEAGYRIRMLQQRFTLTMPQSRPMPAIGPRVHELRIPDVTHTWRIVYRIDDDVILVVEIFSKKTTATPHAVIERCRARLGAYDRARQG